MSIRSPSVDGLFYDSNPNILRESIKDCFFHDLGPGKLPKLQHQVVNADNTNKIYGIMAPHAGYYYSGHVAAFSYFELVENGFPDTFIILCPNHTGIGTPLSISVSGTWKTPLGNVEVDSELATKLVESSDILAIDDSAHIKEHSIEVHLPFLQYFAEKANIAFKIVPISMWSQDIETSTNLANSIIEVINSFSNNSININDNNSDNNSNNINDNNKGNNTENPKENCKSIGIIASTDFSHYVSSEIAYKNDNIVLNDIANLNETSMMDNIQKNNISMCGYGPVATTIIVTRELGASKCEILKYATSGDVSGDNSSVVAYASGVFK